MHTDFAHTRTPNLADALDAVDRAPSASARVQAAADAMVGYGFGCVLVTLRDASLSVTLVVSAGALADEIHVLQPLPGVVWRRRLPGIERFNAGELYVLDGTDAWVSREFFGTEALERPHGAASWIATDLIVGLVRGVDQDLLGIVQLAAPVNGQQLSDEWRRDIGWLLRHLGARLAHDNLRAVAQRRAERLQRLQEAGAALARSLDESEIIAELARQAARATDADGIVIATPDLQEQTLTTHLRVFRNVERPAGVTPLGEGVFSEVARSGKPVRLGDRRDDRTRELSGASLFSTFDVVGSDGPAASVMAVPLLMGFRLIGVIGLYAVKPDTFSPEDEEVIATIASQAATAIVNARRYAESERERRQTEALADVARAVGESLRPGDVLRLILRHSVALLGAGGAVVALRNGEYMHIVAAVGEAAMMAGVHVSVEGSLLGKVVLSGERVVANDYDCLAHSRMLAKSLMPVHRVVIAPLTTARGIIGAIAVSNRDAPFTDEDGRILQRLADHVAVAIVNARLFEEVERATREWKVAFDSIASGMVVLDDAHRIRRCNARARELCNAETFQSLIGLRFGEGLLGTAVASKASGLDALMSAALESGVVARSAIVDERGGRMFEVSASPHPDGGLVVTFDDVTVMHKLAERHKLVVETASDALVITLPDHSISMANPAAHDLFQRNGDLLGMLVARLLDEECVDVVADFEAAALSGTPQRYECRIVRPGGEMRRVSVSSAPIVEMGKITGTVASLRDITEQHGNAVARARTEAQYERIVEAARDSIFTVDVQGRFTAVNGALERATGRLRAELIGVPCMTAVDPRDAVLAQQVLANTMAGTRQHTELRYLDTNAISQVCLIISSPILEDGVVVGALGLVREIATDQVPFSSEAA